jgi:hypothetical protein
VSDKAHGLRKKLEELDAELKRTQTADESQRRLLHALQQDVQALLERSGETPLGPDQSISQRMRASLQHFETTHPLLTVLIQQVLDSLSAMGI